MTLANDTFEAFKSIGADYEGRITFPIRDLKNRIVCFLGRSEEAFTKKKYLFTPPHTKVPLFPLKQLQLEAGAVLLVEGIFDMLNLYDNGFRNVLCIFGTNSMNEEKLNLLKVLGVTSIDVCLDPDKAGQDAAAKIKEMAEEMFFTVRNIDLKDCDPGDLTPIRAKKLKERLYG